MMVQNLTHRPYLFPVKVMFFVSAEVSLSTLVDENGKGPDLEVAQKYGRDVFILFALKLAMTSDDFGAAYFWVKPRGHWRC